MEEDQKKRKKRIQKEALNESEAPGEKINSTRLHPPSTKFKEMERKGEEGEVTERKEGEERERRRGKTVMKKGKGKK